MNVTSSEIPLEGSNPVGLSEPKLWSKYHGLVQNMEDGRYKELEYKGNDIEFWLRGGLVYLVRVWSKLESDTSASN